MPQAGGIYLAYNIYLGLCMTLGLFLNLFVTLVHFRNGAKNSTDWFIVFINIYDFIISTVIVPVHLTKTTGLWQQYGNDVICKLHMSFTHFTIFSSAFLIVGLAMERYFKVCRPARFRLTGRFSRNSCIIMSITTFSFSLPTAFFYDNNSGLCRVVNVGLLQQLHKIYFLINIFVFLALFVTVVFSYSNIAIAILKSKANIGKYSSTLTENDNTEMKCVHCIVLLCCGYLNYNNNSNACTSQRPTASASKQSDTSHEPVLRPTASASEQSDISHQPVLRPTASTSKQSDTSHQPVLRPAASASKQRDTSHQPVLRPAASTSKESDTSHQPVFILPGRGTSGINRTELTNIKPVSKQAELSKRLKTIRLTFLLCFIFVLSWTPPWVWYVVANFMKSETIPSLTYLACNFFLRRSYLINVVTSPILMISLNESFRKKAKDTIMCKKCTKN